MEASRLPGAFESWVLYERTKTTVKALPNIVLLRGLANTSLTQWGESDGLLAGSVTSRGRHNRVS